MAVPKRKMSRSNTRARRSQWKTTAANLTTCPQCKGDKLSHAACPTC
ncbi:50S ribosomal protein L32, partial [Cellulosimicrobium cellulans]